jgi:hypothetical protein
MPESSDAASMMLPDMAMVQVAASDGPIEVQGGRAPGRADLTLRSARLIDPPLLVTLPLLLEEAQAAGHAHTKEPLRLRPSEQSQRRQIAARLR